ncbi:Myocardin-related transcription factor [Operophtera brumata]|uniref:Myocardin-related transcription factor n=1 Tax=Operophtera brumata TaxID=104452 RepID=A0A0L7LFF2_OPEBR|nr:Myocardin-related transcription factor [Operophtera brumata]
MNYLCLVNRLKAGASHLNESRSACGGGGGSEGSDGRASWRVTLDHDLVETLSAIYPEWFKPQHRRAASPVSPASPHSPCTPPSDDTFSSGAEEMAGRQAGSSGASEPPSSPRVSPPKVKLMMRRPINQLVAQGIMPPLKTPPAYFEQCKQLERAKTGDLLKAKIQRRPDRQELERRHILEQESHVDPSLAEKQRMLKKARLADQLNDQLSHRPGPLELIKKNILHTEEDIETAVKSGSLAFKATCEGASGRPEHPVVYCGPPEEVSPSPSPPSTLSPVSIGVASPREQPRDQHPAPGKSKPPKKNKGKTHHQTKARFKFHEYKGPPNAQKASSPLGDTETPYELLLQQQQLLLQLMLPASPAPSSASVASDSSDYAPPPPPPLPVPCRSAVAAAARIEDMKVSDLRAECKRRNLRVGGPKPTLIDRLRPFLVLDRTGLQDDSPRSPASVASSASVASPEPMLKIEYEPAEDIVQSQRRQIEELERKLEASRQQLEALTMSTPIHDSAEDSQIMDDVLEILVENGELPPSAVQHGTPNATIDSGYSEADAFSPADVLSPTDVLTDDVLGGSHARDSLAADELQRELDDIQNEIMSHADMHASSRAAASPPPDIDPELSVDLLSSGDFHADFGPTASAADNDDFFERFFSGHSERVDSPPVAMDVGEDATTRRAATPLSSGDILEHARTGFDYIDELTLPSFDSDDTRPGGGGGGFDLHDMVSDAVSDCNMHVDSDAYDCNMETDLFPNMFGRGHVPQYDPLLGSVLPRPPPRPALKHYSWDRIEFDAT